MNIPTKEQIDAANVWLWASFRIEDMPEDHDVHTVVLALRALRLLVDEPSDEMIVNAVLASGNNPTVAASITHYKAMRDKLLEKARV